MAGGREEVEVHGKQVEQVNRHYLFPQVIAGC